MKSGKKRKIKINCSSQKPTQFNTYSTSSFSNNTNSFIKTNLTQAPNSPDILSPIKSSVHKSNFKKRNLCEGGMNCPNYKVMKEFKVAYYKCLQVNIQLKKMNEVLQANLAQKSRLYMNILNDSSIQNESILVEKNKLITTKIINNRRNNKQTQANSKTVSSSLNMDNNNMTNSLDITIENNKMQTVQSKKISFKLREASYIPQSIRSINRYKTFDAQDIPKLQNKTSQSSLNQYDRILDFSNRNLRFNGNNVYISLLSINKDYNSIIKDNTALTLINTLVSHEKNYFDILDSAQTTTLLSYYDAINFLIKDYKELIKLNLRMKDFIKGSITLVESVLNHTSTSVLINNACSILDCERATLFIYDKVTDMLVVHSGEGLRKCQIKIPKDAGIAGSVFMSGKKLRIDDAYLDARFNKEIDKSTNYRTKNILCYPLINRDGITIGCIQAINKNLRPFDSEDEELLNYFSQQASAILVNVMDSNEYWGQFHQLRAIIDYSLDLVKIKTLEDFTLKTEEVLMNAFNCINAQLMFNYNYNLLSFKSKKKKSFSQNIGFINLARSKKEIIACRDVKISPIHNILIDLDTNHGLITFPIIITEDICAIAQVPSISKISNRGLPASSELSIIQLVNKCITEWCRLNLELFS